MVRSQDNLTIVASEIDFSNQQRISYQQAAGVIPAASSIPSIHYALSEVFHYSLKRNSAPPRNLSAHRYKIPAIGTWVTLGPDNDAGKRRSAMASDRMPGTCMSYCRRLCRRWNCPPIRNALRCRRSTPQKLEK